MPDTRATSPGVGGTQGDVTGWSPAGATVSEAHILGRLSQPGQPAGGGAATGGLAALLAVGGMLGVLAPVCRRAQLGAL